MSSKQKHPTPDYSRLSELDLLSSICCKIHNASHDVGKEMHLGHSTSVSSNTSTKNIGPLFLKHQATSSVALTPMLDYDDRMLSESQDSTMFVDSESYSGLSDSDPTNA